MESRTRHRDVTRLRSFCGLVLLSVLVHPGVVHPGTDWPEIPAADLGVTPPESMLEHDAMILLKQSTIRHTFSTESTWSMRFHHVRIKILTPRGVELYSDVVLVYDEDTTMEIRDARTVQPDGQAIALPRESIQERTLVRKGESQRRAKSFAMPAVQPGSIIEYRWNETARPPGLVEVVSLHDQLPTREFDLELFSLSVGVPIWWQSFNMSKPARQPTPRGSLLFTFRDLPASKKEPYAPDRGRTSPWFLLYYARQEDLNAQPVWDEYAGKLARMFRKHTKRSNEVAATARRLADPSTSAAKHTEAAFDFCRDTLRPSPTAEPAANGSRKNDREAEFRSPREILASGHGSPLEIDATFAALVEALGGEARLVALPNPGYAEIVPRVPIPALLDHYAVAVREPDGWAFFDPSSPLPPRMLPWQLEGVAALVADPDSGRFYTTPVAASHATIRSLAGEMQVARDGTLEGDLRLDLSGHFVRRWFQALATHENRVDDLVVWWFGFEPGSIHIRSAVFDQPVRGNVVRCRIVFSLPDYAATTSKRQFLKPLAFGQQGSPFSQPVRRQPIHFEHTWSEVDSIRIVLPEDGVWVGRDTTLTTRMGEFGGHELSIESSDKRHLRLERRFHMDEVDFPAYAYPMLRQVFSEVASVDALSIEISLQEP